MTDSVEYCDIFGTKINVLDMDKTKKYIYDNIDELRGEYICVSNVHTTIMAHDDEAYRRVQNEAALRLPDGKPLSVVSRKRGHKDAGRVTGPDLMRVLFEEASQNGLRMYFYGSTDEILKELRQKLDEQYKGINIAGMYSPPFRRLTDEEDKDIINMINDTKPDIIWIGLGAPKQEIWMNEHKGKLNGVMIGVGAGFDYFAGRIKRAPQWMQKAGLEWLYRLMQEPKRLFKRYFVTNSKFIYLLFKESVCGHKN